MSKRLLVAAGGAMALLVTACGGGGSGAPADGALEVPAADVETLGGQEVVDEMARLYRAAVEADQTTVTVYGPGETDREGVYEVFAERFPGITVEGEFIFGADLVSRVNQEFASGKHIAGVMQNGDTTAAAQIKDGRFVPFAPVSAAELPAEYTDGQDLAHAASVLAFGPAYNTNEVTPEAAPKGWRDILDPKWKGRMVMEDPTSSGGTASTLSHLLWDGRYDEGFVRELAATDPRLTQSVSSGGTAVATGEYAMTPIYPYSFYLRAKEKGAPLGFVFPVEGGNHTSAHFLSLLEGAPNPEAAKLFITWMFTPEAQQAIADVGQWGTMPDAPGPEGYPALSELDLLKPFPLDQVAQINNDNIAKFTAIFTGKAG